ncbi:MAG: diacylglycerol kinase family protein [Chthoniobacterales bacterium]
MKAPAPAFAPASASAQSAARRIAVILNPAARGERARRLRARIEAIADGAVVLATSRSGDAESLARTAVKQGFDTIVAAGGDGTVNEVVNGMAGSSVALGILPLGTMNVFATELGLPTGDLERCWEIIAAHEIREVDLPDANGKHFVQLAGVGFDAQVVQETSQSSKRSFGPLSYLVNAAQIAARTPPLLQIESEHAVTTEGSFVLVGNGRLYGGPFPFFKQAVIDDGLFDVLVFKRLNYLEIVRYMQDVIFSSAITAPEVEYFQTTSLRVSSETAVPVEVDGELIGHCPVEFQIRQHGLRVCAPPPPPPS